MEKESFSKKLKNLRNQQCITQAEMARKLHVSRSCIANYEKGERQPDMNGMRQIAAFFHVSTDYLLGCGAPHEKPTQIPESKAKTIDISVLSPEEKMLLLGFYRYLQNASS